MAYKRTSKTTNGVKRTTTVNNGGGKRKGAGITHTNSYQTGKGNGFSARTTFSRQKDGTIKTTKTTNNNGWVTRTTSKSYKPKPEKQWKAPRKDSAQAKFNNFVYTIVGLVFLFAFLKGMIFGG